MSARLLLVSADTGVAQAIRGALESAASLLRIDNLSDGAARAGEEFQPGMVLVDADAQSGIHTAFERIAAARRRFPAAQVIALGNEMSAQLVLAALRAGASDFVDRDAAPDEWRALLNAGSAAPQCGPGHAATAAILSAVPNVLDEDFALNLALRAARQAPQAMTLFLDLSLPASAAGIALNMELKFTLADALREIARLDRAFLESAVARCPRSGLYGMALTSDVRHAAQMPAAPDFLALLQILQSLCDIIVICYGAFSHNLALSEGIDAQTFLCCNQRFTSIRAADALLHGLRENKRTPHLVIHAPGAGRAPLPADIRKVLAMDSSIDLDTDWNALTGHFNDAAPLALGGSARYGRALDSALLQLGLAAAPRRAALKDLLGKWLHPVSAS
jgi:pilus assembly protein CpaE